MNRRSPSVNLMDDDNNSEETGRRIPSAAVDEFGLPMRMVPVETSAIDGSNGEMSNTRSIGIAPPSFGGIDASFLAPPSLISQRSLGGIPVEASSFNQKGLCDDDDFGAMCPPPPSLTSHSSRLKQDDLNSATKTVPVSKVAPAVWKIPQGAIQAVPDCYPLEQSSVFVEGSNASDIAVRISDCLRRRSIAASYGEAKAKAKCKTMDGVEFRVRLYAGRAEYGHGIIVEVQRRSGWSAMYQQDVSAILEAAEGVEEEGFDMSIPPIDDLMNGSFDTAYERSPMTPQQESIPLSLIQSHNFDTKLAGMEILGAMTDASKVGSRAAKKNASRIFHKSNERDLRRTIIEMIRGSDYRVDESIDNILHDLALRVLANCIEILAKERHFGASVQEESWIINDLLPVVVGEIRVAEDTPNEAVLAVKCLKSLLSSTPKVNALTANYDILPLLSKAMDIGTSTHYSLQHETSQCVTLLQCR